MSIEESIYEGLVKRVEALEAENEALRNNAELIPLLKDARKELHACQAVIHLAGGFDPAYVSGAQKVLKAIDAAITGAAK